MSRGGAGWILSFEESVSKSWVCVVGTMDNGSHRGGNGHLSCHVRFLQKVVGWSIRVLCLELVSSGPVDNDEIGR